MESVHRSCILLLWWNILLAIMRRPLEWTATLVHIPLNLGPLVDTRTVSSILNVCKEGKFTYARLIMQVRANIALWTELVEM